MDRNTDEAWPKQRLPYESAIKAEYLYVTEEKSIWTATRNIRTKFKEKKNDYLS